MFGHFLIRKAHRYPKTWGAKCGSTVGPRARMCIKCGPPPASKINHVGKHPAIPCNSLALHTFWIVVFWAAGHAEITL